MTHPRELLFSTVSYYTKLIKTKQLVISAAKIPDAPVNRDTFCQATTIS